MCGKNKKEKESFVKKILQSKKKILSSHITKKISLKKSNENIFSQKVDSLSKSFLSTNTDAKSRNALSDFSQKSQVDTIRSTLTIKIIEKVDEENIRLDTVINLKGPQIKKEIKCKE